ncbi:MAG: hypothetical protein K8S16_20625 [Bacteroidales bacterium]|nr:hypothetical protein [Bacteroidales bacterium]
MDTYKPYTCLYKKVEEPAELKSCFVVWLPAGKRLTEPVIRTVNDTTTITYTAENHTGQTVARQEEYENTISWNGQNHFVEVIVAVTGGGNHKTKDNSSLIF